ncbi:NAD(P)H-dependent flavin oxidoreductase [Miniphocaeibacter halophilus]|uniref:Nitronate monooxygenase n=1 Tax=Miniphocaeibacter halophilus TaxID=2931922 RepID=A0AC61MTK8_9FIRM|nr:nitronate monooxygenase family protein [Miniphocaeibacter halophilus]QQK08144.1 nitronate monooxygenase [Miniphocaeibacter halophilus]
MSIMIGSKEISIPVIQGGMGVGVSLGNLAGSVAREGGIGTISMVDIGFKEPDFYTNKKESAARAFTKELNKAREISKGNGLIATNIMAALTDYKELVKTAVKAKVDAIVVGAGLPLDLPGLVETKDIMIAPIISSARALKLVVRNWMKKYDRTPDFVVLEGRDAGGHLGFKKEEIINESYSLETITKDVLSYLDELKNNIGKKIPLFVGGSFFDGNDLNMVQDWGATGIQIGTRFIATEECDVSKEFKDLIVKAKEEDIVLLHSPVGMPARAIKTPLIEKMNKERIPSKRCINCLKTCNPKTTNFCISDALISSANGDVENGLFFSGSLAYRIKGITTVEEIFKEIKNQWRKR